MQKIKFGLKIKILIGISILLVFTSVCITLFSYKIVKEDKEQYVFDSENRKIELIASRVTFLSRELSVLSEILNKDQESGIINVGSNIFKGNAVFLIFKKTISDTIKIYSSEEDLQRVQLLSNLNYDQLIKIIYENTVRGKKESDSLILKVGKSTLMIHKKVSGTNKDTIFIVSELGLILENYSNEKGSMVEIISGMNRNKKDLELSRKLNLGTKNMSGTSEFFVNNDPYLGTYKFLPELDSYLVSVRDEREYLGVTRYLAIKIILFSMTLLMTMLGFGVIISNGLTNRLQTLSDWAYRISKGEMDLDTGNIKIYNDEIGVLTNTFGTMINRIKFLINELNDQNMNLEKTVVERTAQVREKSDFITAIVDSVDEGIFVFDKNLDLFSTYSKSSESIFGISLTNKSLNDLFPPQDEVARQQWSKLIFEKHIPFRDAIMLGPRRKITGSTNTPKNFKQIDVKYFPLSGVADELIGVVGVANDVTKQVLSDVEIDKNKNFILMMLKILKDRQSFGMFYEDTESRLQAIYLLVISAKPNLEQLMTNLHTLNGNFAMFNMFEIKGIVARLEEEAMIYKKSSENSPEFNKKIKEGISRVKKEFDKKIDEIEEAGVWKRKFLSMNLIDKESINKFMEFIANNEDKNTLIKKYEELFLMEEIGPYFVNFNSLVDDLSRKLNKKVHPLNIKGGNVRFHSAKLKEVLNNMVHVFRNIIDHGIETPEVRNDLGKNEFGNIEITIDRLKSDRSILEISIADDGAGINVDGLRKILRDKDIRKDSYDLRESEIIDYIFSPYVSSRSSYNDISGRGVGLAALRNSIDSAGGSIEVQTVSGRGTLFLIHLPS